MGKMEEFASHALSGPGLHITVTDTVTRHCMPASMQAMLWHIGVTPANHPNQEPSVPDPYRCPRLCHPACLSRWQLHCAGKMWVLRR